MTKAQKQRMRRWLIVGGLGLAVVLGILLQPGWLAGLVQNYQEIMAKYDAADWRDFTVAGIAQGSLYGLIALGYTLVYGIMRMINFAHGEVFMFGAFSGYFISDALFERGILQDHLLLGLLVVMAGAVATSIVVAVLLERIAYRPLRRAPRLVPLITAIGASLFLQYTASGLYGPGVKTYPELTQLKGTVTILGIPFLKTQAVVIVSTVLMMTALYYLVQHTRTGKAMRAVSEDKDTAALMGVNVDAIIVRTFVIGAALAGAAGVLYALLFRQVNFYMGFQSGMKAFTAAVLGGIGNVPGAMVGGLFLGLVESLGPALLLEGLGIPAPYQLKDALAFALLVVVLIFRPTGILGERVADKRA